MKIFLVDTENTNDYSFLKDYSLNKRDKIVLFATTNSKRIRIEDMEDIFSSNAKVIIEKVLVGTKNALDFQLVTYLALCANKRNEYFIVSNDKGYNISAEYLIKKKNINVNILSPNLPQLNDISINKNTNSDTLTKIFESSKNLNDLFIGLVKIYGEKKARNIYNNEVIENFMNYKFVQLNNTYNNSKQAKNIFLSKFGNRGKKYINRLKIA